MRALILLVFLPLSIFALTPASPANTKHAPLPDEILRAKSVCIVNQTKSASLGDRAYDEISKWGRFKVVAKPEDADLVLVLSASSHVTGYDTNSNGQTNGTAGDDGNVQLSSNTNSHSEAVIVSFTYLTVVDRKSGTQLWSDGKQWGNLYSGFRSATLSLIKELRKRVEEEEHEEKGKAK